jgi:hypothetical protein
MIDYDQKLADEAAELVTQLTAEMADYLRKHTRSNGLLLSGELVDSIEQQVTAQAGQLAIEAVIQFNTYGRFKDMRTLSYSTVAPAEAMKRFVEKIGIGKFAYVPGYEFAKAQPITARAIQRIANAIAFRKKYVPSVTNTARMGYNPDKMNYINVTRRRLLDLTRKMVNAGVKEAIEALPT